MDMSMDGSPVIDKTHIEGRLFELSVGAMEDLKLLPYQDGLLPIQSPKTRLMN